MTVFTKDPRSPEVLAELKKEGQVLLEVMPVCPARRGRAGHHKQAAFEAEV